MTLTQFEDALHSLVVAASGLTGPQVGFAHLNGPVPSTGLYARIERLSLKSLGSCEVVSDTPLAPPGNEITLTTSVSYEADVRVQVFGAGAFDVAAAVESELATSYFVDLADTLGVTIGDVSLMHVPALFDATYQDRAAVSAKVNFIFDRTHRNTYISTIYGEATVIDGGTTSVIPFGPIPSGV